MKKFLPSAIVFVVLPAVICGCRKVQARRIEGTYSCSVDYHYWEMSSPSYTIDSTYTADLLIDFKKDTLTLDGFKIPIDSVRDEQLYHFGGYHYSADIQFVNDSLYFYKSVLIGLGGGYSQKFSGSRN
jgi:hypothetical protein